MTVAMKPLFNRGISPTVRLALAAPVALALIVADSRTQHLEPLRATLSVVIYPLHYLAALPTRLERALTGRIADEEQLRAENAVLRRDNLALQGRLQTLAALEAENRRLRGLLGSAFRIGERVLVAELLEVALDPYRQQILVNKGSLSGVFVGQPVLDAHAVMGQVVHVGPLTATVLLITDATHSLPVQINRNGLRAIASGTGLVNQLQLLHVAKKADVRPGDLLITSGLGGIFPPGYPVARVSEVRAEPGDRFATVLAEPTARLDSSHEVLLVWTLPESPRAAMTADEPVTSPPGPKNGRAPTPSASAP